MSTVDVDSDLWSEQSGTQDHFKQLVESELQNSTYEASWVRPHWCPIPDETKQVDKILDSLRGKAWCDSPEQKFRLMSWPGLGSNGEAFYEPFTDLINKIVDAFQTYDAANYDKSFYHKVRLSVYHGRNMAESAGEDALNPNLLAFAGLDKEGKASWHKSFFVGEVQGSWAKILAQAGIHARCLFAASDHRVFIPVLALNYQESEFRLCFYHRSGVLATTAMKIITWVGFRDFVAAILGMWYWQDLSSAGYVPSHSNTRISLNDEDFHIHQVACRRQAIHGQATTVYVVDRAPPPVDTQRFLPKSPTDAKGATWDLLDPFDMMKDRSPSATENLSLPERLPDSFVIKCCYQPVDRIKEEAVFSGVRGYIGIPDILTTYDVLGFDLPKEKSPQFWAVFPDAREQPYEPRVHRHLVIESLGKRLHENLTFKQVGFALLHAMIGHCALFSEGGYLHRDVSLGNIVILLNPIRSEWRIPRILESIVKSRECSAVLIDGDVAKEMGSPPSSSDRSGTLPFISARLAANWLAGRVPAHTPIDDLESFPWVLLYCALAWGSNKLWTAGELNWWKNFQADDLSALKNFKQATMVTWANIRKCRLMKLSPVVLVFRPLLHRWFALSDNYTLCYREYIAEQRPASDFTMLFNQAYQEFVQAGNEEVHKLPDIRIHDYVSSSAT